MEIEDKDLNLISQGAEAKVYIVDYLGEKAILKQRLFKKYRHPILDEQLSTERITQEVKNMAKTRKTGVNVPYLQLVDLHNRRIYMELIPSTKIRDFLFSIKDQKQDSQYGDLKLMMSNIAEGLAKMHDNDIIHGDLTTSNLLLKHTSEKLSKGAKFYDELYFIDFGLSYVKNNTNDKGIDLYVLEKAFLSTHPEREKEFSFMLEEYQKFSKNGKEVINKLDVARSRGRKKVAFG